MLGLALGAGSQALGQETGEAGENADESEVSAPERTPVENGRAEDAASPSRKPPTRRKKGGKSEFDPKVFEARGRELQGEYYEIASFAQAPSWSSAPAEVAAVPETSSRSNWLLWTGAAGLTAIVAGAAGYLYLENAGPDGPESVYIDDKP